MRTTEQLAELFKKEKRVQGCVQACSTCDGQRFPKNWMDGWTDGRTDRWTDEWIGGWMDRQTDGRTGGRTGGWMDEVL